MFRNEHGAAVAATFEELSSLFAPGFTHVVAERRRRELDCEHLEAGAPPLGVDLDRGVVRITPSPDGSGVGPS
ncbi:DUF6191 domain-containing protein [Oryzihumus sp.]